MYFSKIEIKSEVQVRDIANISRSNWYDMHKFIWSFFDGDPEQNRDFLYHYDNRFDLPRFYTVSERPPIDISGLWNVNVRSYSPIVQEGQKFAFMLRVNPVCSKRDENHRQHRHDVVMEAKTRYKKDCGAEIERKSMSTFMYEAGTAWLISRAEKHGFNVHPDSLRVEGYRQHRFYKGKGNIPVSFSTLEFQGLLTVIDQKLFINTLLSGIGPAKGFGCGMLMIRRN